MGDRARFKREFGSDITLWGGFDQQEVLPFGTPEQVREEAKKLLDDFMPAAVLCLPLATISRPTCRVTISAFKRT